MTTITCSNTTMFSIGDAIEVRGSTTLGLNGVAYIKRLLSATTIELSSRPQLWFILRAHFREFWYSFRIKVREALEELKEAM